MKYLVENYRTNEYDEYEFTEIVEGEWEDLCLYLVGLYINSGFGESIDSTVWLETVACGGERVRVEILFELSEILSEYRQMWIDRKKQRETDRRKEDEERAYKTYLSLKKRFEEVP